MTNADVPWMAMEGVIQNPVNPFTGNPVNGEEKRTKALYINDLDSSGFADDYYFGAEEGSSWRVSRNIFDDTNWKQLTEEEISVILGMEAE